jgi:hypothetical protein
MILGDWEAVFVVGAAGLVDRRGSSFRCRGCFCPCDPPSVSAASAVSGSLLRFTRRLEAL